MLASESHVISFRTKFEWIFTFAFFDQLAILCPLFTRRKKREDRQKERL